MNTFLKFRKTHENISVSKKQITNSIIFSAILGFTLGFAAKILDSSIIPPTISVLGIIGSRFGIWIFISTLLSVYSYTPKLASIRVFLFLIFMLLSYYTYTVLFLELLPLRYIIFWCIIALLSMIPAYIIWFSKSNTLISSVITALPISLILFEGYMIYHSTISYYKEFAQYENVLISNGNYYFMITTEILYLLLIIIILFLVPIRKKQCLYIIPFSLIIFSALVLILKPMI